MSGTSFGTVVLHVAPESAVGGPLALVATGDTISLDAEAGRLDLELDGAEFSRRRRSFVPPVPRYVRGYGAIFLDHVTQADRGCDFDILQHVEEEFREVASRPDAGLDRRLVTTCKEGPVRKP